MNEKICPKCGNRHSEDGEICLNCQFENGPPSKSKVKEDESQSDLSLREIQKDIEGEIPPSPNGEKLFKNNNTSHFDQSEIIPISPVINQIQKSDLSIHLLDQNSGKEFCDVSKKYFPQRQVELGIEYAKHQLIWLPDSINLTSIKDVGYKKFINQLTENPPHKKGFMLHQTSYSEVKNLILTLKKSIEQEKIAIETSAVLNSKSYPYFEEFDLSAGNHQLRLSLTDPDTATSFIYFDDPVLVSQGNIITIPQHSK